MQRIFHPVGQGAFFSERFSDATTSFNVVYDCGSTSLNAKYRKTKINSSFRKNETIDILFISHFHADHINGIEFLMKNRKIKNVVIPYLDDDDKALLKISNLLEEGYIDTGIIDSPEAFFGEGTSIIRIAPDNDTVTKNKEVNDGFDIDKDFPNQTSGTSDQNLSWTLASGTPLKTDRIPFWVFIPFNYKMTERVRPFIDAINDAGLSLADLDSVEKIQINKKKLIKAYEKVESSLNKTSLVLYSGPNSSREADLPDVCYFSYKTIFFPLEPIYHLPACLYTGDADFNEPNIISSLQSRLLNSNAISDIGTIVAPHHGAIGNFELKMLDLAPMLQSAIFPFGKNNCYGHPSDAVVAHVVGHNRITSGSSTWRNPRNMIVRVTEDVHSVAIYKFILP